MEEISESFLCCVCLELLYKPVVLCCGHMSCFWCVHKSMNGGRESHCPICRRPYIHFPSICEMLHFLLVKMYPEAYERRRIQILEEEERIGTFSPQIDAHMCHGTLEAKLDGSAQSKSCTSVECSTSPDAVSSRDVAIQEDNALEIRSNAQSCSSVECLTSPDAASSRDVAIQENDAPEIKPNENFKQISRSDLLCVSCKQLLFRPIVLNCGHVYCKSCLISPANEKLKCQVCGSLHPGDLPSVCRELDHFLEEQFPEDYALKRREAEPGGNNSHSESSKAYTLGTLNDEDRESLLFRKDRHFGVGCDFCGMYPIIGDRYRCKDCVEKIGFDLCGDCYNSRSKLPGRFNQQHKPEHKFECIKPDSKDSYLLRLMTGIIIPSRDRQIENAPDASSPGPVPPTEVAEGPDVVLHLPFASFPGPVPPTEVAEDPNVSLHLPFASSPGPVPPTEVAEDPDVVLHLPFEFEAIMDEDQSETEEIL